MIEVKDLVKQYGKKRAVDDISFTVNDGEIVGFLGPNGAGKTTTMNIITGYISATQGEVRVDGMDVLEEPMAVRRRIGYLPEQPPLYMDMTVNEYLNFVYRLKGASVPRLEHLSEICEMVGIQDVSKRMIRNLSKGYKQRVGLAQALIGNPDVLILDEPTVGLDPKQIIDIRNVIKDLGESRTIILSSHILPEVQMICERILVINNGQIVANGSPENLSHTLSGSRRLMVRVLGENDRILSELSGLPGINEIQMTGQKEPGAFDYSIETLPNEDVRQTVFLKLAEAKLPILMMKPLDLSLEDIFLKLTTDLSEEGMEETEDTEDTDDTENTGEETRE